MIKRIAITGPESTGKSNLARFLAEHFSTIYVPEYAREYLNKLNRPYTYDDILTIAKGQLNSEKSLTNDAKKYLFCDTELIVTKIWCEFRYKKCHPWIIENLEKHNYDLYLLMNIDLPWQSDPQREHRDKRKILFDLYVNELKAGNFPFVVISGKDEERNLNGLNAVNASFNKIFKGKDGL